jgi:hypothetical protein
VPSGSVNEPGRTVAIACREQMRLHHQSGNSAINQATPQVLSQTGYTMIYCICWFTKLQYIQLPQLEDIAQLYLMDFLLMQQNTFTSYVYVYQAIDNLGGNTLRGQSTISDSDDGTQIGEGRNHASVWPSRTKRVAFSLCRIIYGIGTPFKSCIATRTIVQYCKCYITGTSLVGQLW